MGWSIMSSRRSPTKSQVAETILIVEPDVVMRMVISDYLRECGYKVVEAVGFQEATAILGSDAKVDAVFAEVQLPGDVDGFSLAQWIRTHKPAIEIILTSGVKMAADKAGDLCEDGPLGKPYDPDQVVRRLRILFEKRRKTQS